MLKKLTNKKGFTLMEMLIVVAIIAVLVAIAIPTFNNALEKSECAVAVIGDTANKAGYSQKVDPVQTVAGFANLGDDVTIGGVNLTNGAVVKDIVKGTAIYVNYSADGTCTFSTTATYDLVP